MMRKRFFGLNAPALLLFGSIVWIMSGVVRHVRAEPAIASTTAPSAPMGAFGLLAPLNSFEQTLLVETLKGIVFALIIAFAGLCANRVIERYKLREALFSEYLKKRAEKVIAAWDKLTQLDSAWSNLIMERSIVELASKDPANGITNEEMAQKLREAHEGLKSQARPQEVGRLEFQVEDLKKQIVRSIDGEVLWLGTGATKELQRFYHMLCRLMRDHEEKEKKRQIYLEEASSLSSFDQFRAGLEYMKGQPQRIREAASQRAEIEGLKLDLLKIIRKIADAD